MLLYELTAYRAVRCCTVTMCCCTAPCAVVLLCAAALYCALLCYVQLHCAARCCMLLCGTMCCNTAQVYYVLLYRSSLLRAAVLHCTAPHLEESATTLEAFEGSLSRSDVVLEMIEDTIVAAIANDSNRICRQHAPTNPTTRREETEATEDMGLR